MEHPRRWLSLTRTSYHVYECTLLGRSCPFWIEESTTSWCLNRLEIGDLMTCLLNLADTDLLDILIRQAATWIMSLPKANFLSSLGEPLSIFSLSCSSSPTVNGWGSQGSNSHSHWNSWPFKYLGPSNWCQLLRLHKGMVNWQLCNHLARFSI